MHGVHSDRGASPRDIANCSNSPPAPKASGPDLSQAAVCVKARHLLVWKDEIAAPMQRAGFGCERRDIIQR